MGMRRVTGPNGLVQYVDDGEEEWSAAPPTPATPATRTAYSGTKSDWLTGQGYQNRGGEWYSPGGEYLSNNIDGIEPGMWDHARNPHSQIVPGQYDKPLTVEQQRANVAKAGNTGTPPGQGFGQAVNTFAQRFGGGAQVYGAPQQPRPTDAGGSVPAGGGMRLPAAGAVPPPPPPPPPAMPAPRALPTYPGGSTVAPPAASAPPASPGGGLVADFELEQYLSALPRSTTAAAPTATATSATATAAPASGGAASGNWLEDLELEQFLRNSLNKTSPYDEGYIAREKAQIDAELGRARTERQRGVREEMGARGLIGPESSPWAGELADLEAELALIEGGRKNDLLTRVAEAEAEGRRFNAGLATNLLGMGEQRRQFDTSFGEQRRQFDTSLGESQRQFDTSTGLQKAGLGLQKYGIDTGAALQREQLGENRRQFDTGVLLERERQTLDKYRIDLSATLEQQAQDLQRFGLQSDQALRYAQLDQDGRLRARALDLTEKGMQADEAFRTADLELRQSAYDLQKWSTIGAFILQAHEAGIPMEDITAALADGILSPEEAAALQPQGATGDGQTGTDPNAPTRPGQLVDPARVEALGLGVGKTNGESRKGSDGLTYRWDGLRSRWYLPTPIK